MFREHVGAGELRALFHKFVERVLAVRTDVRHVPQVNDELATVQLLSRVSPRALHFRCPGENQLAFENQLPLDSSFNNGDSEHLRGCLLCR